MGIIVDMKLKNHTSNPNLFFEMLPEDWQEHIVPYWENLKATSQLFVLVENDKVLAGGLVFSKCPPDMMYYEKEANNWFKKGYLYLGYIFVDESQRNRKLGSLWLDKIKEAFPHNGLWLSIEDVNLHKFYIKNGFRKMAKVINEGQEESIYAFKPQS